MYAAGLTDKGKVRQSNQDTIFISSETYGPFPNLFIVADGMGGHNAGDIASIHAVKYMLQYIRELQIAAFIQPENFLDLLVTAVQEANGKLCQMAEENDDLAGMGTTLTTCTITPDKIFVAHVGDSRAYAIYPDRIKQLTTDHSYVSQMVEAGEITEEEATNHPKRHVITRVLGTREKFEVDGVVRPLEQAKSILLCSDGLTNMVTDAAIKNIIDIPGFPEQRVKFLIEEANLSGGLDNISALLIDLN